MTHFIYPILKSYEICVIVNGLVGADSVCSFRLSLGLIHFFKRLKLVLLQYFGIFITLYILDKLT